MTHRERILAALEHRQPDRVPKDLGSSRVTGMVKPAYERLCAYLGFGKPGAIVDRMQQVVAMDEEVLRYFDVDVRAISRNPPDHGGDVELGSDRYADEWGVVRRKPTEPTRPPACSRRAGGLSPVIRPPENGAICWLRFTKNPPSGDVLSC
jgi:uroporphyrinogen decarboxylase